MFIHEFQISVRNILEAIILGGEWVQRKGILFICSVEIHSTQSEVLTELQLTLVGFDEFN